MPDPKHAFGNYPGIVYETDNNDESNTTEYPQPIDWNSFAAELLIIQNYEHFMCE